MTDRALVWRPSFLFLLHAVFATTQLVLAIPLTRQEVLFKNKKPAEDATLLRRMFLFNGFPIDRLSTKEFEKQFYDFARRKFSEALHNMGTLENRPLARCWRSSKFPWAADTTRKIQFETRGPA